MSEPLQIVTSAELATLNSGECPDCGSRAGFLGGPEGGLTQNICCVHCRSGFNYCPPCVVAPNGFAERIGKVPKEALMALSEGEEVDVWDGISVAILAIKFCVRNCDKRTLIHHPDCLSMLWNSKGELVHRNVEDLLESDTPDTPDQPPTTEEE